jgi:hypothetical protein
LVGIFQTTDQLRASFDLLLCRGRLHDEAAVLLFGVPIFSSLLVLLKIAYILIAGFSKSNSFDHGW